MVLSFPALTIGKDLPLLSQPTELKSQSATTTQSNVADILPFVPAPAYILPPVEIFDIYPKINYLACSLGEGDLSPHFTCKEARFFSRDLTYVRNAQKLAYELEKVRLLSGPIKVHSWCRSVSRNRAVGGVKNSTHLTCLGGDFSTSNKVKFRRLLQTKANVGLGYYANHTHVDTRVGIIFYGVYAFR